MEIAQEAHPFRCPPVCSFCDSEVFSNSGVDEWSVIVCTSCLSAGIHVRCYNKLHGGKSGTELAMSDEHYFCSKVWFGHGIFFFSRFMLEGGEDC